MTKGRRTAGSGGRIRKSLAGRGPTPKAEDREYHAAHKAKQDRARRSGAGAGGSAGKTAGRSGAPGRTSGRGLGKAKSTGEWIVGRNAVLEALQAGLPVRTAYIAEGGERDDRLREILKYTAANSIPLLQASRAELDRLTGGAVHQSVALLLPGFEYAELEDVLEDALESGGIVVACDQVTDPHNLGAIIRSAAGFGAAGVVIPSRRSAKMTAAAWKASAGTAARLPVARVVNLNQALDELIAAGFTVIGLAGQGDAEIGEVEPDGPVVLVVGSEGEGLSRLVREHCETLVRIPMAEGVESLNVSVATAIALYELTRP